MWGGIKWENRKPVKIFLIFHNCTVTDYSSSSFFTMVDGCDVFREVSPFNYVTGYVLALGIFSSYLPQHFKIIKRRSSEGLSPIYLFFGSISAVSALLNVIILSSLARSCCSQLSFFQCTNSLISLSQISMQSIGCILVLVLCVYITRDSVIEYKQDFKDLVTYYHYVGLYLFFNILILSLLTIFNHNLTPFADLLGLVSTTMALIQFFPQLIKTYNIKHAGTLSIPSMLIQTPGGFFWSYSMYSQPNSNWSTYLPFLTSAFLQATLLIMCLYFQFTRNTDLDELATDIAIINENRRSQQHTNSNNEQTPLLV